jgi:hypothetical protein
LVFDKLVARWEERSEEAQKKKNHKEEEKLKKRQGKAGRSRVRLQMLAALQKANKDIGGPIFEYEWRGLVAHTYNMRQGALRVAFSRHRQALIDAGEVIDDNGRITARDI